MSANRRDIGLVRALGPWGLTANIFNMIVGAGIFAVPAALAASIGPYAPLAFLACAIGIGSVAICFAEGGSRMPTSGGVYGYIEAALGPLAGYIAGTLFWIGSVLGNGAVAAALADVVVSLLPQRFAVAVHAATIIGVVGGIALVNVGGIDRGARLVNATTLLKLIPLAIFIIAGAGAVHRWNFVPAANLSSAGLGRALILALFAFVGMDCALCASGEVMQPARTIPKALAISMVSVTLLYVAIQVIAQGILGSSLAHSSVPLADAMAQIAPALRVMMLVGAAVSMFVYLGSDILGSPRMLFAMARDGLLPRALGRLQARSQAPHIAILCYAVLAIALALSGTFAELAVLATLTTAAVYAAGCAAAWQLARRGVELAGAPLNFRALGVATVTGMGSMLLIIALAARAELIALLTLIIVSAGVYLLVVRRSMVGLVSK